LWPVAGAIAGAITVIASAIISIASGISLG
jgi:hypothetical protein